MGACVDFDTKDNDIIVGFDSKSLERAKALKNYNDKLIDNLLKKDDA